MYEAHIGDKTYEIHTGEMGKAVTANGHNKKFNMRVELSFGGGQSYREEVQEILKSLYIRRITGNPAIPAGEKL